MSAKISIVRVGEMAKSFVSSMGRWAKSGFSVADKEAYEARKEICTACEFFTGTRCSKCGCFTAKLWLKTEKCLLGKW